MEVDVPEQKVDPAEGKVSVGKKDKKRRSRRGKLFDAGASIEEKKQAIRSKSRYKPGERSKEEVAQSIVYIGHLPNGFEEREMRGFFAQFGKVERVKLVRSKRTGKSCGYGYVQFEFPEVAKVVADTMNNYLVKDKLLKCHVIPPAAFSYRLFELPKFTKKVKGSYRKALLRKMHDAPKLPDEVHAMRVKVFEKLAAKKEELSKLGVELKETDVLDTTEKVAPTSKEEAVAEEELSETISKKGRSSENVSKKKMKQLAEKEEEEAILFALHNMPGCKKLLSTLSEVAKEAFVVPGNRVHGEESEDEELDATRSSYAGHEVRIFGEDSEIELKTPPGMKKRKMKSREGEVNDVDDDSDFDLGLSDSGDEGFEDTVVVANTPKKSAKKSPKASSEKKSGLKIIRGASSTGKKNELGLTRKEELRRLNNKKRLSGPAGDALVSKTFKNTAFLDRSLNRKRISKRADEMDDD